jgi:hypothetical protein
MNFLSLKSLLFALVLAAYLPGVSAVQVVMQHYDFSRTGANLEEVLLAPANVNTALFGKLFTRSVDGAIYTQPLYVPNLTISNQTHNVVFVATEHNSVYAFDADNPTASAPLWQVNLGSSVPQAELNNCGDLPPEIGITGTPTIELVNNVLYLDSKTRVVTTVTNWFHSLHALDLLTGQEKFNGPVVISATVSGQTFDARHHHNRPGLLLLSNVVYVAFGSHCDWQPYHGWLFGYNATNLQQQTGAFITTPTGNQGAIWSCGMAPAVNANGFLYVVTGNGTFDANTGGSNFAQSFLKLSVTNGIKVADWFAPYNAVTLSSSDRDIGTGGAVLLPGTHLLTELDKSGTNFLVDQNHLGHFSNNGSSDTNIVQEFAATAGTDGIGQCPVYWNGPTNQFIFIMCGNGQAKAFLFNGSTIQTTPLGTGSVTQSDKGGGLSLSANGNTNGILWAIDTSNGGTVRAYDAARRSGSALIELWDSQQNATRDALGAYTKFCAPTIANGRVYAPTASSHQLVVYGSFAVPAFSLASSPASQTVNAGGAGGVFNVTIASSNSFANPVALTASGLPPGVTASFNPPSVTASGSSVLTVTASNNVPQRPYPFTISGNAGSLTNSTAATLVVGPPPAPGITFISLSANTLVFSGTNGPIGGTYKVLASPDVSFPLATWTIVTNGLFDALGNFAFTNVLDPLAPQQFFRLLVP